MRARAGLGGAHAMRQAIDATDFDATARSTKPHVNGARDRQVVWVAAWVLPKQWVAGSNPVSRSNGSRPSLEPFFGILQSNCYGSTPASAK